MKKIIQAFAVCGILVMTMGHAMPAFAVPRDSASLCLKYSCTFSSSETATDPDQS